MQRLFLLAALALASAGLAATGWTLPAPAHASGSYTARPPQPGASGRDLDRALYSLGQRLFNGEIEPKGSADAAEQVERLRKLQASLPAEVAAGKDLPALAGRLAPQEFEALEYFVARRYGK